MTDKTKLAISAAIDALGRGVPTKTNGKITAINLAREAGVSKATLYRYFEHNADLASDFEAVKSRGATPNDDAPVTLADALENAKVEIASLRKLISDMKEAAAKNDKLESHQVFVLWKENQRLSEYIKRMESKGGKSNPFSNRGRTSDE